METKKTTKTKECKQCKRGLNLTQKSLIIVSVYMLFAAIYGTIQIIKDLNNFF